MINELFPFQQNAVRALRQKASDAHRAYEMTRTPQVVSLQAPTGSGKTIMMASLIETIYTGDAVFPEQPNAIFVWLSDSPELNQQSKEKIDLKADKIRPGQTIVIDDASFDRETLEDGKIYFLNTQKKGFYPDFLIVRWDNAAKSGFVVDILEPHGQQFADGLAKAKGLAEYAADEDRIGRVQIIRKVRAAGGVERFIRLDLGKGEIRDKVIVARNDDDLCALFDQYGIS